MNLNLKHRLKLFIKLLTPPLFIKIFHNLLVRLKNNRQDMIFNTYDDALKYCQNDGYQNSDIVEVVVQKNRIYRDALAQNLTIDLNSLRTVIGLALVDKPNPIHVLDFGGGAGYHYFVSKLVFGEERAFKWAVVETSAMARESVILNNSELKFFDSIDAASKYLNKVDIVFSSGALHCCPDPKLFLSKLLEVGAPYFYITRTCFSNHSERLIHIQESQLSSNGPGPLPIDFVDNVYSYPNVFISRRDVEHLIKDKYMIRFKVSEEAAVYSVGGNQINMYGYFCTKLN